MTSNDMNDKLEAADLMTRKLAEVGTELAKACALEAEERHGVGVDSYIVNCRYLRDSLAFGGNRYMNVVNDDMIGLFNSMLMEPAAQVMQRVNSLDGHVNRTFNLYKAVRSTPDDDASANAQNYARVAQQLQLASRNASLILNMMDDFLGSRPRVVANTVYDSVKYIAGWLRRDLGNGLPDDDYAAIERLLGKVYSDYNEYVTGYWLQAFKYVRSCVSSAVAVSNDAAASVEQLARLVK